MKTLITAALIALVTAVILNTSSVKVNAKEIEHNKAITEIMIKTLTEALDKQTKHLENIDTYLRDLSKEQNFN